MHTEINNAMNYVGLNYANQILDKQPQVQTATFVLLRVLVNPLMEQSANVG